MAKKDTYEQWREDGELNDNLAIIQSLSRQGFNHKQIGKELGITDKTLQRLQAKYPSVKSAIKKGRRHVVALAENALFSRIKAGDTISIIYALKVYGGEFFQDQKEMIEQRRREIDIKAQEFEFDKQKWEQENLTPTEPIEIILRRDDGKNNAKRTDNTKA